MTATDSQFLLKYTMLYKKCVQHIHRVAQKFVGSHDGW